MRLDFDEIDELKYQLESITELRPFKTEFKTITKRTPVKTAAKPASQRRRGRTRTRTKYKTQKITEEQQQIQQTKDFAKLLHSALIDTSILAKPTIESDIRKESALKYTGMWASGKVNINTAPRHVLEAVFSFGGNAVDIAQEIIERRRNQPFKNIEELKKELLRYSVAIEKGERFIITESNFFTIKVTASSGSAKAYAIIAIIKSQQKTETIGLITG